MTESVNPSPGAALAAQREIVAGQCVVCARPFTGTRKRRYCSATCSRRGWDRRQRGIPENTPGDLRFMAEGVRQGARKRRQHG